MGSMTPTATPTTHTNAPTTPAQFMFAAFNLALDCGTDMPFLSHDVQAIEDGVRDHQRCTQQWL